MGRVALNSKVPNVVKLVFKVKLVSIRFKLVAVRFKLVAKLVAKVIFVPDPTVHSKMAAKCLSRFLVSLQCSKENFPRFYLPSSRLQCSSAIYPIQSSR